MGILSFLRPKSVLERRLVDFHARMFLAMSSHSMSKGEARRTAARLVDEVRRQAINEGTFHLSNAGKAYFELVQHDPSMRKQLDAKRLDGVTDADIHWWWDLHDLERRMMVAVDDWSKLASFRLSKQQGLSEVEAVAHLRRFFPIFGDPTNTTHTRGDDRPLPYELKKRVSEWSTRNANDPEIKRLLEGASSCNAGLRSEIRAGRL